MAQEDRHPRLSNWSGYALGFSLGGFFDGILLHQVLQWHHLLSGLEAARQDVRVLILADGVFHLVMYLVAAWGLWLLWRGRHDFAAPGADRRLFAAGLLGFGAWHVVDAIISHWLLGIHRIRMDADNPLLWDLLWLAAFGIVPLVLGLALRSSERTRPSLLSAPLALVLAIAVSAPLAALPPPGSDIVMVLFHPGVEPAHALAAIRATGSELIWTDPSQQLWAVRAGEGSDRNALYGYGALLVSNSILPAGCLDWTLA